MIDLQNKVLEKSDALKCVANLTAELDCLMSFAACAKEFNYVRPKISEARVVYIKGGRHPLQELCVSPFVPNDTHFDDMHFASVVTGPNASGKSVYLKQVYNFHPSLREYIIALANIPGSSLVLPFSISVCMLGWSSCLHDAYRQLYSS